MPAPIVAADEDAVGASSPRLRDADSTRSLLLQAARRRFARDGYAATTVRDIASDAGVNVALINRYFTSKEGLFEACLNRAAQDLHRPPSTSIAGVVDAVIRQLTSPVADDSLQLVLLLRTSGDARADQVRRDTIRSFAEGMAGVAGGTGTIDEETLLRAEVAICAALGIALLRSNGLGVEPLTTATAEQLRAPLEDVFESLLAPRPRSD